jgi:hypothetical protein
MSKAVKFISLVATLLAANAAGKALAELPEVDTAFGQPRHHVTHSSPRLSQRSVEVPKLKAPKIEIPKGPEGRATIDRPLSWSEALGEGWSTGGQV